MARHRRERNAHEYPRTARLNELVREIVAEELERVDDERLELVTVVAVAVEADLRHATVTFATLGGAGDDEAVLEALGEARPRLQRAIGQQARVKRTPELRFEPDEVGRSAARIDEILRGLDTGEQPDQ